MTEGIRLSSFLVAACLLPAALACAEEPEAGPKAGPDDPVVARVDGDPILMSELLRELVAANGEQALARLIARTLVLQESLARGVTVTEAEIDAQMALDERRLQAEMVSAFRDAGGVLRGDKTTLEDIVRARFNMPLKEYRDEVVRERLLVRKCVLKGIEPTDGQLREFFAAYRSMYDYPARYRASHLLISPFAKADAIKSYSLKRVKPDEAQWGQAMKLAGDLKARLDRGEPFEELVRQHSMDRQENVAAGGDVGWFANPGRMDPAFSQEATRLKVGEASGPVRTPYGYHLIKLTDCKPGKPAAYEEVADRVRSDYLENLVQLRTEDWLAGVGRNAKIECFRKTMWPSAAGADPVVAKVNGGQIARSRLLRELVIGEGAEAAERLINRHLTRRAVRELKAAVSDLEVDMELNRDRLALDQALPGASFDEYVQAVYGLDAKAYRASVRERLEIRKCLKQSVAWDEKDLRVFYAINSNRYLLPERYMFSRILVRPVGKGEEPIEQVGKASPEQWMAARERADGIVAEAKAGAKFETLVVRHSDDRLGIVKRFGNMAGADEKDLAPEVKGALQTMAPEAISAPIRTAQGIQIVRLERKIAARRPEFDEVRERIEQDYLNEQVLLRSELLLRELRERAKIEYLMDLGPRTPRAGSGRK